MILWIILAKAPDCRRGERYEMALWNILVKQPDCREGISLEHGAIASKELFLPHANHRHT
jgi:hypothetical protein